MAKSRKGNRKNSKNKEHLDTPQHYATKGASFIKEKLRMLEEENVVFSFKFLESGHPKFKFHTTDTSYTKCFLERIRDVSSMSVNEFMKPKTSSSLRSHKIRWQDTTETSFGILNEDEIVGLPWQFSVSSNKHGRIHGFIIRNCFYVVWIDKNHKLYA